MKKLTDKIIELTGLIMKINLETKYAAFIKISGHISWIEISVRESKDQYNNILYDTWMIYYDELLWDEDIYSDTLFWDIANNLQGFINK